MGAAAEVVVVVGLQRVENALVGAGGSRDGQATRAVKVRQPGAALAVPAARQGAELAHQLAVAGRDLTGLQHRAGHAAPGHQIGGQIDAPALQVLAHVAQDVGELHGLTELQGVVQRLFAAAVAADRRDHEPDHPGHPAAVQLQIGQLAVLGAAQVHLEAQVQLVEGALRKRILRGGPAQRGIDRVWLALPRQAPLNAERRAGRGPPVLQRVGAAARLVGDIVAPAAGRVDRPDRFALGRRKKTGAEIKGFGMGAGQLAAVLQCGVELLWGPAALWVTVLHRPS